MLLLSRRGYLAPEHIELTKMSTKSDIYSLGILIMEIVTGEKCPSNDNGSPVSFITNVRIPRRCYTLSHWSQFIDLNAVPCSD